MIPPMPKPPRSDPAARFRGTRAAHRDETAEDYVEAIGELISTAGVARVGELARMMGVSHVTVSRIVARLARSGLVDVAPHRSIALTPAGARMAQRARRRHDAVLNFLLAIGVPRARAEIDAEGIEHHVSDVTIRAMTRAARQAKPGA